MKKLAAGLFLVVTLVVVPATVSYARGGHSSGHGGGHGGSHGSGHGSHYSGGHGYYGGGHGYYDGGHHFVGGPWWGPWWWGGPYPYAYPSAYYAPPYGAYPPGVVVEGPSVYIQRLPPQSTESRGYWYYCASAQAYYPTVPECPEDWIKVPPAPR